MTKIETGKHAFPTHWQDEIAGMELRDYFAAKAMSGFLASFGPEDALNVSDIAEFAYKVAGAMIRARGGDRD